MKKTIFVVIALAALSLSAGAQQKKRAELPDYSFTPVISNTITPIKDQHRSGTCWAFSTIGFVESEVIRINNIKDSTKFPDFSEMFVISKSYQDRAEKYIRLDGNLTFAAGSEADDVLDVIRDYGLVPESAMPGLNYGAPKHDHTELDAAVKAYVKAINEEHGRTLTTAWKKGFTGIVDAYLGECPETFEVDGKTYTPASYRDKLKFNPEDYVTLTSFTHHPFYTWFPIEVCDNWRWDRAFNVPIEELMLALDFALEHGYTAAWGADVSEFGFTRDGLAVLVDAKKSVLGSDQAKWTGADATEKQQVDSVNVVEIIPDQESRQKGFDNKEITDDHGMQIYGIAKDQNGKKYYMVKNSWGPTGKYNGIWYATENFVIGQTLDIVIHKDALPASIRQKIGK